MRHRSGRGRWSGSRGSRAIYKRPWFIALVLLILAALYARYKYNKFMEFVEPYRDIMMLHQYNALNYYLPYFMHGWILKNYPFAKDMERHTQRGPPVYVPELINATWPGSYPTPQLRGANTARVKVGGADGPVYVQGPAWVSLYIFSTSSAKSAARRRIIREYSPLAPLPEAYRGLVELKFVLGLPKEEDRQTEETIESEKELQKEMEQYNDIIRLTDLVEGDNMNRGKSFKWLKWVGRHGRESQWVFKCDDDTLVILPNLLNSLLPLDPSQPTYLGSGLGRWAGYHYYFEGMFYGFNWGVVKTMSDAPLKRDLIEWNIDEDARIGEMMWNLPPKPPCPQPRPNFIRSRHIGLLPSGISHCRYKDIPWNTSPPAGWSSLPQNPDPRSGLYRHDYMWDLGNSNTWYIGDAGSAVGWHWLKEDWHYTYWWEITRDWWVENRGGFVWEVPESMKHLAQYA